MAQERRPMTFDPPPGKKKKFDNEKKATWVSDKDFAPGKIMFFKLVAMDEPFEKVTHWYGSRDSVKPCTRNDKAGCPHCEDNHKPTHRYFWDFELVSHKFESDYAKEKLTPGTVVAVGMNYSSNRNLKGVIQGLMKESRDPEKAVYRGKKLGERNIIDFEVSEEPPVENNPKIIVEGLNTEVELESAEKAVLHQLDGKPLPRSAIRSCLISEGGCSEKRAEEILTIYFIDGKIVYEE